MEFQTAVFLSGAGLIGGMLNAIAGGATLITFPAMLAAGIPPMIANASNAVAVSPGHLIAALADRHQLPVRDCSLIIAAIITSAGGATGAALLLITPEYLFTALVPALVGIATVIFAYGTRIQASLSRRTKGHHAFSRYVLLVPTAIYGGYFGAGLGIMLLAVLAMTSRDGIRAINALKNVLATTVSLATLILFAIKGLVSWPETTTVLAGALAGGALGGRLIAVLPQRFVRAVITGAGSLMTAIYAWRYWY
jgi:uncharacterized protein